MRNPFKYILFLPLALITLMLNGCIMDDFDGPEPPVTSELNTIGYMAVRLQKSGTATRASFGDGYDAGNADDVALSDEAKHYAIIYDGTSSLPCAIGVLSSFTNVENANKKINSSLVLATIVAKNESRDELTKFKDCYVILNSSLDINELWNMNKTQLTSKVIDSPFFYDKKGNQFLTMANSVYVDNGYKTIYTAVDTNMIFESYLTALEEASKGNAAITAYVERLSAKFSLSFNRQDYNSPGASREFIPEKNQIVVFSHIKDGVPYYENIDPVTGTPYTYKVKITGWGLNALETKTNLFRNFNVNQNYFSGWYSTADKRAFWSEDPHYNKAVYPLQYRRVIDNSGIPVYQEKYSAASNTNLLLNLSYDELNSNRFTSSYLYSPENTYNFMDASFNTQLANKIEYLAGTHIIACAEVLTNLDSPGTWKASELYRDRNGNFYKSEKDAFRAMLCLMYNALESHASLKFTYFDWSKGGVEMKLFAKTNGPCGIWYNNVKITPDNFEQYLSQFTAPAEFKGSDGKRIIWYEGLEIRDSQGNPLEIYSNIDDVDHDKDVFLRLATVNDFKSILFETVGAVEHFNAGKMYYAIPVGYIQNDKTSTGVMSKYDIYGVVRNSEYQIMIHDVTGLGTSVDNVTEPIVPNQAGTQDHLYVSFKILDWHLTEQNVPGVIK